MDINTQILKITELKRRVLTSVLIGLGILIVGFSLCASSRELSDTGYTTFFSGLAIFTVSYTVHAYYALKLKYIKKKQLKESLTQEVKLPQGRVVGNIVLAILSAIILGALATGISCFGVLASGNF